MAKLFSSTHASIGLQPATIDAMRGLPSAWRIVLNVRPPGGSEMGAIIATERAVHVVEFKFTKNVVTIQTESDWHGIAHRPDGLSPKEQVTIASDAFKKHLGNEHPRLVQRVVPWVILERQDRRHRYGAESVRPDRYYPVGHVLLLNGIDHLQSVIERAEDRHASDISATERDALVRLLGGKPLARMRLMGKVQSLQSGEPLPGTAIELIVVDEVGVAHRTEVRSDADGAFDLVDLPHPGRFHISLVADDELKVYPGGELETGEVVMHFIYVSPPVPTAVAEDLVQARVGTLEADVQELMARSQRESEALAAKIHEQEETLELLYDLGTKADDRIAAMQRELEELRRAHSAACALTDTNAYELSQRAIASLEERFIVVHQIANMARIEAQNAAASAASSADEAKKSVRLTEDHLALEQARDRTSAEQVSFAIERRRLRSQALVVSAAVGGAGALISMQPIPFADNLILTPMQIGLVLWIGHLYGRPATDRILVKILGVTGLGMLAQSTTIALYKLIPGAFMLGSVTVPAFTILIGFLAVLYFESGRTLTVKKQAAVMTKIGAMLSDRAVLNEIKVAGAGLFQELKARRFKVTPTAFREILQNVKSEDSAIAGHLDQLLDDYQQEDAKVAGVGAP